MKSPQRKSFIAIALGVVMSLALVAPLGSTYGGKVNSLVPIRNWASEGADVYRQLLPELAAPHRKKLEAELGRLKQFADELSPRVLEAQKKTGFDAEAAMKEFREAASVVEPSVSAQAMAKFHDRYASQMLTLAQAAGLNLQADRTRLTSLIDLSVTRPVSSETNGVGSMDEGKREEPPSEPPPPAVTMKNLGAPYTSQGYSGEHASSDAATGSMRLVNAVAVAGSAQKLAFITQDLRVEPGVRRVRVFLSITPTDYSTFAFNLGGYSSAEAIVNLRLLEGSRVVASDRISLAHSIAAAIGDSRLSGSRPVTLQCEFTRPSPDDDTTYTLVAEIEGWAGAGGLGGAATSITASLRQFQVYLHR